MGLKLIGSIPGYFVGIGLLLTFTGIVLALSEASAAIGGQSADAMLAPMTHLLGIASFKFATSIAGLGISIILALAFKIIVISIEGSLAKLCANIELQLRYTAPQSIAAEMNETAKEQSVQLKEINSDRFFSRMGEQLSPQIGSAFAGAIAPISASIDEAMRTMATRTESGMGELLDRFSTSVQSGAGTELKQLSETLSRMHATLETTQKGLHGTGEEFATRMTDAANALRETFDRANTRLDADLGSAASGAAVKVEDAMARVMERLETQLERFMSGLVEFGSSNERRVEETSSKVAEAQQAAVAGITSASLEVSKALEDGLGGAMKQISSEIDRLAIAMRSGEAAFAGQASAIGEATDQTRKVAHAFSQTAQDVRAASVPLLQSSERIGGTIVLMGRAVDRAASSLEAGNAATSELATTLTGQLGELRQIWEGYRAQFQQVDQSLARAVEQLGGATEAQAATLGRYATDMNKDLAAVLGHLRPLLDDLEQNTGELAESIGKLVRSPSVAAE